jgi:hypothetical protein
MILYVVTENSVFSIAAARNVPVIVKRVARRDGSQRGVGDAFKPRPRILITNVGVIGISPEVSVKDVNLETVNAFRLIGPATTPIVGLFLKADDALQAVTWDSLRTPDPRFKSQTKEALDVLSRSEDLGIVHSPIPDLQIRYEATRRPTHLGL